jgi:hypothetical protein
MLRIAHEAGVPAERAEALLLENARRFWPAGIPPACEPVTTSSREKE